MRTSQGKGETMPALVETLASYVPALVTRRIAANPALLDTPFVERFAAAVLFADIAGFTPLTETFVKRGPEGVEQLSQLLNDYLGKLINLLTAQGGDMVKFAGDGLLAMWPAGDEPLSVVTQRAAQCGLAVQNALHQYPAAEGISLSLRVVVGVGDIFATHIGGLYQRWEFLIAGSPLVQVSIAKPQTEPGEVILSPEAW